MYQIKKSFLFFLFIIFFSYTIYQAFVRSGYQQAIIIEDVYWGIEKKAIKPDSYDFIFRRLIPERIKLHPIYIQSRYLKFIYKYSLPPNEILGLDDSFSVKLDLVYVYDLDPNKLPDLFIKLEQKDWKYLDNYIQVKLKDLLYEVFRQKLNIEKNLNNAEEQIKAYVHNGFLEELNLRFQNEGVYFKKVYIQDVYVPDVEQYNLILRQSNRYLERKLERSALIDEAKAKKESQWILFQFEKEKLQDIAKLIREYPEVKDYLKIEKLSSQAQFIYLPSEYFNFEGKVNKGFPLPKNPTETLPEKKVPVQESQTKFVDKTPP
jgi:hypothetical protein